MAPPPARHVLRSISSVLRSRQLCTETLETKKVVSPSLAALGACRAAGGPDLDDFLSDNTPLQDEGAYSVEVGTKKDPIPEPPWMKRIMPGKDKYNSIKAKLGDLKLHTVCEEAKRPNIGECWTGGQTAIATIMTLDDTSTQGSSKINPGLDINWDNLGFGYHETDYMFVSKSGMDGKWETGEVQPLGDLKLSPSAGVLNYGQGIFEGLKAYRTEDGRILLFRPQENAMRMIAGADRLCMPAPPVEVFVKAVKQIVLANMRWIPPPGKGSLYIRPLLIGSGAVLGLAPSPEYSFVIFVAPVGNYFKEGISPIHLKVEDTYHRAAPGGTGGFKTIGNYASVLKTQLNAKKQGFSDVLYLDAVENKYLEEVSSCNVFLVKGNRISTPQLKGTILPGITRKSIIELARSYGYEVEECDVSVDALRDADEVFCSGTAVVISPVGSISLQGERILYANKGLGKASQELYAALTSIQMGKVNDKMAWTMEVY